MSRAYLNLGVSPGITPLAMLRIAIRRLHPDTLAVAAGGAGAETLLPRVSAGPMPKRRPGPLPLRRFQRRSTDLPRFQPIWPRSPHRGQSPCKGGTHGRLLHPLFLRPRVGSPEKATAALGLLARLHLDEEGADDPEYAGFAMTLQGRSRSSTLWFMTMTGKVDIEGVIRFVLRLAEEIDLTGLWGF